MVKRLLALSLVIVLIFGFIGEAQSQSKSKSKARARIDSAILQVIESVVKRQGSSYQTARALGVPFDGNAITINVVFNTRSAFGASAAPLSSAVVQAFGSTNIIAAQSRSFLRLKIPISLLPLVETLTQLIPNIAYIRPPLVPQTLAISEGVSLIGADQLHNNGNLGQGVKIAVIDLGFAGLSSAKARGELPNNVITRDFTGTGLESSTRHGTAVAEILHDVAPNAQLYLMKIGDEIDLENAVAEAMSQGIRIINHSVGWFNTSYYDGTGAIANIIQPALSAGVLWVNSAGNYGQRHFKGLFRDSDGDGWTEFSGNDESIDIRANAGETIQLYLTWRDWPFTAQDYDLVLLNAGGAQVAISDKTQNGAQQPTESLRYFVPATGNYRVQVKAFSANAPKELTLFSLFHNIEHAVARSSLVTPADMNGVLSVAAIRKENWNTGTVAPYSSRGPTNDGRAKPDISGPDNVATTAMGTFEGTSAAAPHVAGAAALLMSQNTGMSALQAGARLRATAASVGSPTAAGSGRVQLTAPVIGRPDLTISNTDFTPRTPNIGDLLQYEITVRNQGNAAASAFTVRLQDQGGTEQRTVSSLAAGASTVVTFSRRLNTGADTISVTVDAANQVAESNENNNTTQFQVRGQTPAPPSPPPSQAPQGTIRTDKAVYQIGESLRLDFSTNARAYAYIYNVDAAGKVSQIFPNVFSPNNLINSGTHSLPDGNYRFTVTGPLGAESLHLLLSLSPVNLGVDGLQNNRFTDAATFSNELQSRARNQLGAGKWSTTFSTLQIGTQAPTPTPIPTPTPPANQRPLSQFSFNPTRPAVGATVIFDASSSRDPDGQIVDYRWDFNSDGRVDAIGVRVSVRFNSARNYQTRLTVKDNQGQSTSSTQIVPVGQGGSVAAPTPSPVPPPTSSSAGFYIDAQSQNQLLIRVQGQSNWFSQNHAFKIILDTNGAFTSVNGQSSGQKHLELSGTVNANATTFLIKFSNSASEIRFELQLDFSGNGSLQRTTSAVFLGTASKHPQANPFLLMFNRGGFAFNSALRVCRFLVDRPGFRFTLCANYNTI